MLKRAARALGRTRIGKDVIHATVLDDPAAVGFERVARWPQALDGFEDLAFLFSSNQLNHGIAALQFDEAALLYRLARRAGPATLAEIGRFRGGSTLVLAAAMHPRAELWSYDAHLGLPAGMRGDVLDRALQDALARYGLAERVHLVVGDSRTAEPPPRPLSLLFVDGDHTYEGARADHERWRRFLAPGAELLFHDAVDDGGYGNHYPGVARLVDEITAGEPELARQGGAGSIAQFVLSP